MKKVLVLSPALIERAELTHFGSDGRVIETGAFESRGGRSGIALQERKASFALRVPPRETSTLVLRLSTPHNLRLNLSLNSPEWAQKAESDEQLVLGVYLGVALAVALLNLFFFVASRSRSFLYCVLFILSMALMISCLTGSLD